MKVLFLTEGGAIGGLGHIIRCSSIVQAFAEKGVIPTFVVNGDESIRRILKEGSYQACNWLHEKWECIKFIEEADVVIIDSYLADLNFYRELSERVRVPVYIDDNKRLDYPRGVVINSGIHATTLKYPEREDVQYLLGCGYAPLRKLFWEMELKEPGDSIESVMITTGGNDPKNIIPKMVKFLKDQYPTLRKDIIIGNGFDNINEIKSVSDINTHLVYYPDVRKMAEIMTQADIAISSGGQTLYELARSGVPTIAFCQSDNQILNLEGWSREGFIEYIGDFGRVEEKLIRALNKLDSKEERLRRRDVGIRLVDGQGAKRIAEELLIYENQVISARR